MVAWGAAWADENDSEAGRGEPLRIGYFLGRVSDLVVVKSFRGRTSTIG